MWNMERPKQSGFYWMHEMGQEPIVVRVRVAGSDGSVFFTGNEVDEQLSNYDGRAEWCGPLRFPE